MNIHEGLTALRPGQGPFYTQRRLLRRRGRGLMKRSCGPLGFWNKPTGSCHRLAPMQDPSLVQSKSHIEKGGKVESKLKMIEGEWRSI